MPQYDPTEYRKGIEYDQGQIDRLNRMLDPTALDGLEKQLARVEDPFKVMQERYDREQQLHRYDLELPLGDPKSLSGAKAANYLEQNPGSVAIVEVDLSSGVPTQVFLRDPGLRGTVSEESDPFVAAGDLTKNEKYVMACREALKKLTDDKSAQAVEVDGEKFGHPGMSVTIMRPPISGDIWDLRKAMGLTGEQPQQIKIDGRGEEPVPLIMDRKGVERALTPDEIRKWESAYPFEFKDWQNRQKADFPALKEGARQSGELITPRTEKDVAQNLMREWHALDMVAVIDPASGELSHLSARGHDISEVQFKVFKKRWDETFGPAMAAQLRADPDKAVEFSHAFGGYTAIVSKDKIQDVYTHGDVAQIIHEGFPATQSASTMSETIDLMSELQHRDPKAFKEWIENYKFAQASQGAKERVAQTDGQVNGMHIGCRTDEEVARNLLAELSSSGLDYAVVIDPDTRKVTFAGNVNHKLGAEEQKEIIAEVESLTLNGDLGHLFLTDPAQAVEFVSFKDSGIILINQKQKENIFNSGDIQGILNEGAEPLRDGDGAALNAAQIFEEQFRQPAVFQVWIKGHREHAQDSAVDYSGVEEDARRSAAQDEVEDVEFEEPAVGEVDYESEQLEVQEVEFEEKIGAAPAANPSVEHAQVDSMEPDVEVSYAEVDFDENLVVTGTQLDPTKRFVGS